MENVTLLFPYILMIANVGALVGIIGYAGFCALSKSCNTNVANATK